MKSKVLILSSMIKRRWLRRRLLVLILTLLILLTLAFQLRASIRLRVAARVAHRPSPSVTQHRTSEGAVVTPPTLKMEDIFIAVKTTGKFHNSRLSLLLETWISKTKAHVSDFLFVCFGSPLRTVSPCPCV